MISTKPVTEPEVVAVEETQPETVVAVEKGVQEDSETRNGPDAVDQDKKDKREYKRRERPKRVNKHPYVEDKDWRLKLQETVTLETKKPVFQNKEDRMEKPNRDDLTAQLAKKNELIQQKRKKIEELYLEKNELWKAIRDKSDEGKTEYLKLKADKEEAFQAWDKAKKELNFDKLMKQKTKLQNAKKNKIEKNVFKGIAKTLPQAKAYIVQLKQEYRDTMKSCSQDKQMTENIKKFEKALTKFESIEKLSNELDEAFIKVKEAKAIIDPLFKKFKICKDRLHKNYEKFNSMKEAKKEEEKKNVTKEDKKEEKKKRVLTPEEQKIMDKIDNVRKEISTIGESKDGLFEAYDLSMYNYRKEHFDYIVARETEKLLYVLQDAEYERKEAEREAND